MTKVWNLLARASTYSRNFFASFRAKDVISLANLLHWTLSKAILDTSTTASSHRRLLWLPVLKLPSETFLQFRQEVVLGEFPTSCSVNPLDLLWYSPTFQVAKYIETIKVIPVVPVYGNTVSVSPNSFLVFWG